MKLTDDEASKATGGFGDPASKAPTELYNHVVQACTTTAHLEDSGGPLWEQRVYDTVGSTILQLKEPHRAGQFEIKHARDQEFGDAQ